MLLSQLGALLQRRVHNGDKEEHGKGADHKNNLQRAHQRNGLNSRHMNEPDSEQMALPACTTRTASPQRLTRNPAPRHFVRLASPARVHARCPLRSEPREVRLHRGKDSLSAGQGVLQRANVHLHHSPDASEGDDNASQTPEKAALPLDAVVAVLGACADTAQANELPPGPAVERAPHRDEDAPTCQRSRAQHKGQPERARNGMA